MASYRLKILLGIAVLLLGIVGCAQSATPPPTVALVTPTEETTTGAFSGPLPKSLRDVEQTKVFRFRVDPAQTTVEYAVHEVLLGNDQITRGRTNAVEGEFQLYMQNGKVYIALSNLQVDLRTLTTDNAVRDAAIRKKWLESEKYPKAIFVANAVEGLPMDASQNNAYQFRVTGDMTIRNITHPVTFDITAQVKDNQLSGEGTATIYMQDFGFDPPSVVGKTIVSDPVTISIKGVANLIEG
jgi:polyisoprenoid-binding protein YceI